MMQRILLFVLLGLLPLNAAADGKVFSRQAAIAQPTIPDQRALICWSNGVERLVIETRFAGEGTNFAWVVPLPSPPEIEAATPGVFSTIAYQLRPDLIHKPKLWYALFLGLIAMGWLAISARRGRQFGWQSLLACLLAGGSLFPIMPFGSVFVMLFLLWAAARVSQGKDSIVEVFVLLLLLLLFAGMFLPALATAKAKGVVAADITELASMRIGAFETTTVAAKTTGALLDWLRENEFSVSTNAAPIIADYVKRGWVFVASKIAREQAAIATNSIHPLSFMFRAEQPVYPMRLTGVDAGPLDVELYVFGAERAWAENFSLKVCAHTSFPTEANAGLASVDPVPIMHPLLRRWTQGFPVVTKLSARLSPAQMRQDVMVRWDGFRGYRQLVYSERAAGVVAANWATGAALGALMLAWLVANVRRNWRPGFWKLVLGVVVGMLVVLALVYAWLPKVSVRTGRFRPVDVWQNLEALGVNTLLDWKDSPPKTLDEARRAVFFDAGVKTENVLLGGAVREEDSPGNYVIRQATNGFKFLWYDGNGAERLVIDPLR